MVAGLRGNQFQCFVVSLSGFAESQWFDALVPLERVVAEETLAITYAYGHGAEHVGVVAELAMIVGGALYEECTTRPTYVLVDAQVEVGTQLTLAQVERTTIALGNLVYLIVDVGRGTQCDTGQIVGTEIAIVPMLGEERMACATCRGRLLESQGDGLLKVEHQSVGPLGDAMQRTREA